jgi:ABC-type branched-subunit amino acid transport system ATPase component
MDVSPAAASALVVTGLEVRYGGTIAVSDVSCRVRTGEIVALIGPNGAGKSTLLKAVCGLTPVSAGTVRLAGKSVDGHSFERRCAEGIGLTFQIPRNAPRLTVEEELVAQARDFRHRLLSRSKQVLRRISDLAGAMELGDVLTRPISQLTLGEIRRFELARALVNQPSVLLVDEPASGMSGDETRVLGAALVEVAASGVAVLLVEHNIPFVSSVAKHVVVLDAGGLLVEGPVGEVLESAAVREAYLGATHAAN